MKEINKPDIYLYLQPTQNYITQFYSLIIVPGGCSTNYLLGKLYIMYENYTPYINIEKTHHSKC